MTRGWVFWSQYLIVAFYILATDSGTSDPYSQQPRIVIQDGHLIVQSSLNHNVSLSATGQGSVQVNNMDLGKVVSSAQTGGSPSTSSLVIVQQRLMDQMYQQRFSNLTARISQLEENITDIANKVNQFLGSGQDRISNRGLRRVISKVNMLGDKVNHLTQLLSENECSSNPCRNGGTCTDAYNAFLCKCPPNWEGITCESDVNECAVFAGTSFGCQNGATCYNSPGSYRCECPANFYGIHCTETHNDCSTASHQELCGHGVCIDEKRAQPGQPKYRCICDAGWQKSSNGPACTEDVDECAGPMRRCSQNPLVTCINLPGTFHCGPCPPGYTGNGISCADINECEYQNGGCSIQPFVQCTNTVGSRRCGPCPAGFFGNGEQCSYIGVCNINRGGCHPLATCIENTAITGTYRECRCPSGYVGNGEGLRGCVESAGMSCANNPCQHGTCQMVGQNFHCVCEAGYFGNLCDQQQDFCFSSPCQNGATCVSMPGTFSCVCPDGYSGPTCSESTRNCGGYLTGNNGTLRFPETGMHYDHMQSCAWVITVEGGKVVNLTFDHFSLESGMNCEYDFLQLNDGPNVGSRIIGRFCHEDLHAQSFVGTHNEIYLWFQSDRTVSSTGFSLRWTAVDPECGGILNVSDYGAVNSPGYPGEYPLNRTCSWLVRVPIGKRIQFHFATLKLEHHEDCEYDYLKIFDGASERDPLLQTYCTTTTPPPIITSGHSATLLFHSDNSVQDTGFHITYSSIPGVQGCGGVLTAPRGTFRSPNFPDVYENSLTCEWLIRIHPDNRLGLMFQDFELEQHSNCLFDSVEIYDGSDDSAPLLGRYCQGPPPDLLSNSHQLFIRFRTDASVRRKGFKAEYKTICGGIYTELSGFFSSPYYPDPYPASTTCIYEIRLPPGNLINFTVLNMEIEEHSDCRFDYLEVRDGDGENSRLIGNLCGHTIPDPMISTFNLLWMKFETDGSIQNIGFNARYEAIEVGCGGVMTESTGQISSPSHPDRYPPSVTCTWLIRAPEEHIIRLSFSLFVLESDSQCAYDYVLIEEEDGVQMGRFCGHQVPPILTSMGNSVLVKFGSDSSITHDGFRATYEFFNTNDACGGEYYQLSGVIRSPGYPNHYPHSVNCVWIIHAPTNQQIILNATNFALEGHDDCKYDYLEIRNGGYMTSPLIGKYCGVRNLPIIRSHSNILWMKFKTDQSSSAAGFEIYYDSTATGCGGLLTAPRGTIISPNYPQPYPFNADCEWLIRVSQGSVIVLTVIEIDIEEHNSCMYDYLQIFDGGSENSKELIRICNNRQNPGNIVSTGSSVLVRFRSDFTEEAGGFHLAYQTLCSSVLTKRTGVIESPNFPNSYPHNHNCTWTIEAPLGNNISISFSHLFLETSSLCDADYVEVLEQHSDGPRQLAKFCNSSSRPETIETTTNTAIVRMVTDRSVSHEGFRLEWRMKGCGGYIRYKPSGEITSPNYPNGYPFNTACYWHIRYPPGSQVELQIVELDMEGDRDCIFDFLRVYGGEDENAPRLLNTCHSINAPQTVTSHGNEMLVHFHSDSTITSRGFRAIFRKLDTGCGGIFSASEATILSPNFPNLYAPNDDCEWLIRVDTAHLVLLEFYDFEMPQSTNCTNGHVAIYDGNSTSSPLLLRHCGEKPQQVISSTGSEMLVKLVADGNNVGKGFRAHYKTGCGSRLLADEGGEIKSLNYPDDTRDSVNCSWILYTSEPGESVILTVTHLQIEEESNCTYSSLSARDGDLSDSPVIGEFCGHQVPPPVFSRGSILHVFLKNGGIFRATYGVASKHCGGSYISPEGAFSSPGFPNNYDMNMECVWIIEASASSKVHISFRTFNLEESEHCNRDYVEIHENDAGGRFIGRYCGSTLPSNVTSAHKLWVKFRSDDVGTGQGFLAYYAIQRNTLLNGTEGIIESPGYPRRYHKEENFEWTIIVPDGMYVSIRFLDIGITKISNDYGCGSLVAIYEGFNKDEAASIGEFCGFQVPEPVVSSGSAVTVVFYSKSFYPGSFRLHWSAVTDMGVAVDEPLQPTGDVCWEEVRLNATDENEVISPHFPGNYPDSINCTYIIRAPHLQHIELYIDEMELEGMEPQCPFDSLKVYTVPYVNSDEWRLNTTLCGRKNDIYLTSPTNILKMIFKTDLAVNYKGFHATAKSRCGDHLTGPSGVLRSDSIHPHLQELGRYQEFQCEWYITVRPHRTIQLRFESFNVEPGGVCSTNYLMIRNGGSTEAPVLGNGRYCGSSVPSLPETSSNAAYVQVVFSSRTGRPPMFVLHYSEVSMECGGRLYLTEDEPYQEILSPNYPSPPIPHSECEWVVLSPSGTRMRVDFEDEFHLSPNCNNGNDIEFLDLHDGGTEMAAVAHRFCGHEQPSSVMTTGNALYMRYVTAVNQPQAGFKATVRIAQCGGTISSIYSIIKSPNYPQNYASSQECEWFLKMKLGYHIVLTLTDLETPPAQNCSLTDYLEIRDMDSQGEILRTFCGNVSGPVVIDVPGSQAYVKFKSNSALTAKGFTMAMAANMDDGCSGNLEDISGSITSPNYPNPLSAPRDCFWRIVAPEGRRIRVTFHEFNLPQDESSGICLSYLQIFNASYWRRPLRSSMCGSTLPAEIDSSTTVLNIAFVTHGLNAGEGFSLTYSTDEESLCGGLLPLPSGTFSTPPFVVQNDTFADCKWKVSGDDAQNRTVVFKFDEFDIPGSMANYCSDGILYFIGDRRSFIAGFCGNYTNQVIVTSPYASTTLRLVVSLEKSFSGIHGTYNVSNCGGVINGENATIMSPGYPMNYPANIDCHWVINVPEGDEIKLTFQDIRLELECENDYVLIRNGYRRSSPILGKFCGFITPAPIVSTQNVLVVEFHSDAFGTAPGFKLTTTDFHRGCGGLVHTLRGNFSSPNYPSRYGNNLFCRWVIEFPPGYLVRLEFLGRFDIEMDNECAKDYLKIEEFDEELMWVVRTRKCGSSKPEPIISTSRKLMVTFVSNDRITADGFNVNYEAVCGGNFTSKTGEIMSPDYPNFYHDNLTCHYTIGNTGQYVSLTFDENFSIEGHGDCVFDFVMLYEREESEGTGQGPFCGTIVPATRILQGPVIVRFFTDSSYTAHGFLLRYEILDCGGILTQPTGVITLPKTSEGYIDGMDCTWKIAAQPGKVVALRFLYFELEASYKCWADYLEIRDGNETGPIIGKLCATHGPTVKSTGSTMTLHFSSDHRIAAKGFSAFYYNTYGASQGCGGTITDTSGELTSLDANGDQLYEPNLDCIWDILTNAANQVLKFTFVSMDIEEARNNSCSYDYVEIKDEGVLTGRYCGSTLPSPIVASSNRANIVFHSDGQTNKAGFKIRFETIPSPCGPSTLQTTPTNQIFTTPSYPSPYPINLRCKWTVSRNMSIRTVGWYRHPVLISFQDFDIPCGGDYVEIQRSGYAYSSNTRPVRLCGPTHPHDVISYSGLNIYFHSGSVNNGGRGFNITYRDADCNRVFSRDHGVIANPAYPGRFNSEISCSAAIQTTQGRTISLYFKKFEMYISPNCESSNLKVYDGMNSSAPLLGTYCRTSSLDPIFSTGNALYLDIKMQYKIGLFYITYTTTSEGRGCGGQLYADEGALSSPLYPQPYNQSGECKWPITVPGYHTIKLTFKAFALNSSAGCDVNYVEIYEGNSDNIADRVARFCGTDLPGVHNSRGNQMLVKLVTNAFNNEPGFLLHFESNAYAPDNSSIVLQRVDTEEDMQQGAVLHLSNN